VPRLLVVQLAAALAVLLFACGGDDSTVGEDSGVTDSATPDASLPMPEAPALPVLTPCPEGWRTVDGVTSVTVCDPFPIDMPDVCPDGEARLAGVGCGRVAPECPAGEFAAGLPAGAIYVRPGASGGDGSEGAPLSRIRDAISRAGIDGTVALAAGTYDELVALRNGVTLVGACPERTVLGTTLANSSLAVVSAEAGGGGLQNLTVGPAPRAGVRAEGAGNTIRLSGVVIREVAGWGIVGLREGAVTGESVLIQDIAPIDGRENGGMGISVELGGVVELSRLSIVRAREFGVNLNDEGSRAVLVDSVIHDTLAGSGGASGFGVTADNGALELRRSVVERSRRASVILGPSVEVLFEDVLIRDGLGRAGGGREGRGVDIEDTGDVTLRRVRIADHLHTGFGVVAATVLAEDLVIHDVDGLEDDGQLGRGIDTSMGTMLTLRRTLIERTRQVGLMAADGTVIDAEDLTIRETLGQDPAPAGGRGIAIIRDGTLNVRRAQISESHGWGIMLGLGGVLSAEDLFIEDSLPRDVDGTFGRGIEAQSGARVTADRLTIDRSYEAGMQIMGEGTSAELTATRILDTYGLAPDYIGERGIDVSYGASVTLVGGLIERQKDYAVAAWAPGTRLLLEDVEILDTLARGCEDEGCRAAVAAVGSYISASVTMRRFRIAGSPFCGVHVAEGGEMDLSEGQVEGCAIGACVVRDQYDLDRLTSDVAYSDNGTNLDSTTPPVPEPPPPGELL